MSELLQIAFAFIGCFGFFVGFVVGCVVFLGE